ncbi:hypothetical protein ACFO3D_08930 [Virgibacillus kekensis]|uniref:Uncharacterized protein n=1 Tax=Virgibacillus kekensis TaxID=202261 RepID=A0ABV9DJM1_9BACI
MKSIQVTLGILSLLLLSISLLVNYNNGVIISLIGLFISLILRQVRLQKYAYILGHPDRHAGKYGSDNSSDLLTQAETYEEDIKKKKGN